MSPKSVNELKLCVENLKAADGRAVIDDQMIEEVQKTLERLIQRYGAGARSGWTEEGR
jgi:hypothetical protein